MRTSTSSRRSLVVATPIPVPVRPGSLDDMDPDSRSGLSLLQVAAILRAYWKLALLIWFGFTLLAAAGLKVLPKTYTAMATLIVDTNNKDPLAAPETSVGVIESYVATQTELMQSPVVLLPVIDQLQLTSDPSFTGGFRGDPKELREYVSRNLSKRLEVDIGRGGQLIYVSASAGSPEKAAAIANSVVAHYIEEERRRVNDPSGQRAQRYAEQIVELRKKVVAAQDQIAAFRQQKGITEIAPATDSDNPDSETHALSALQDKLLQARDARRMLESKLSGQQLTSDEAMASPQMSQLQGTLHSLEAQLAQLSTVYGANHAKVLEAKSQIASTQAAIAHESRKMGGNIATELSRAKALEQQYSRAVDEQRAKVLNLRELQGEGAKLELELQSAQSVYKKALDGYDQVIFAAVGNYTNVSVVNPATPPVRASKPNKFKLLLVAMMMGLGLGVAMPFLYELFLDRRLRCRDDWEREFGIRVLAQFDKISFSTAAV